ncbi:hypothetical protein WKW79_33035 [Variovorax robiniae]|uniref:Uncharacterized protein n=1 Tax=Variovorax robiniae TaxID=1836199 RepID=A0ABU8XK12_9BURK
MIAHAMRGEPHCIAFRLYKPDGSWRDIVVGGASEQQQQSLLALNMRLREHVAASMGQAANDQPCVPVCAPTTIGLAHEL